MQEDASEEIKNKTSYRIAKIADSIEAHNCKMDLYSFKEAYPPKIY